MNARYLWGLLLLVPNIASAQLTRGPYVQRATPDSMTIVWRTVSASSGEVRFGAAPDALDAVAQTTTSSTQHEVELTGLSPDTRYCYAIHADGRALSGPDETHCFTTAPDGPKPFSFWVVGDSGTGSGKQGRVRDQMLIHQRGALPAAYIHVGDMAYSSGTHDEFQRKFFEMYPTVLRQVPSFPAIGNHEGTSSDSLTGTGPYYEAYAVPTQGQSGGLASGTEAYYSWDWGDVHFISLESHREELRAEGGAMLTWLQMDLEATDKLWVVVYFHHPPYTKGSHDSDVEISHVQMRERVLPILESHGVDLVLGGHSHIYERSYLAHGAYDTPTTRAGHILDEGDGKAERPYHKAPAGDGAIYMVAGHGGTNVGRDGSQDHPLMYMTEVANGSVLVHVQGSTLRVQNIRLDGAVSDDFRFMKGEAVHLTGPSGPVVANTDVDIRWLSKGSSRQVNLHYSVDGGETWQEIALNAPDSGTYTWTVPNTPGEQVTLRITDSLTPEIQHTRARPFEITANTTVTFLPFKSSWRYSGAPEPMDWMQPGFDDRRWPREPGSFGVCSCLPWEAGVDTFLADALGTRTMYFRTKFNPVGAAEFVDLSVIADSGVVVYINGQEVLRRDIGSLEHSAGAISDGVKVHNIRLPGETLDPFENTVAVAVKKSGDTGVDLMFDMRLSGVIQPRDEATGCGCRDTATRPRDLFAGLMLAALGLWVLRRRR